MLSKYTNPPSPLRFPGAIVPSSSRRATPPHIFPPSIPPRLCLAGLAAAKQLLVNHPGTNIGRPVPAIHGRYTATKEPGMGRVYSSIYVALSSSKSVAPPYPFCVLPRVPGGYLAVAGG